MESKSGLLGTNTMASTPNKNKTILAGHASRLAVGLHLAATAAKTKKAVAAKRLRYAPELPAHALRKAAAVSSSSLTLE
jgi:hypothetical protein